MTNGEAIQRLETHYTKGLAKDSSRLTPGLIYSILSSTRSLLISRRARQKQFLSPWNYQTIDCIELIKAKPFECPCLPEDLGCHILRSKYKIPKVLTNMMGSLIKSVSNLDGNEIFSETSFKKKKYDSGAKYTKTKPDFYIRNDYLYVTNKKLLKVISMEAIFNDPLEAEEFKNYCNQDCEGCANCDDILLSDFPIDPDLEVALIQMSLEELNRWIQGVEDRTVDSKDNLTERSK